MKPRHGQARDLMQIAAAVVGSAAAAQAVSPSVKWCPKCGDPVGFVNGQSFCNRCGWQSMTQAARPPMRHVAIDFGNGEGADYWAEEITIEATGRWLNLAHGYAEDGTAFNTASVPLLGGTWQVDGAPGPAAADRLASGEDS